MVMRKALWFVLLAFGVWACGGSDDGTVDTIGGDGVGADVTEEVARDTVEETTPDAIEETTPDTDTVEETTPDTDTVEETTPDTVEETTPDTDTVEPVDEAAVLLAWLEGEGGNYLNTAAPKVIGAADVLAAGLDSWVILDLRVKDMLGPDADGYWKVEPNGVEDYDDGHIEGAIKVAWKDVVTYAAENLSMDDKILVVCWTGESASSATGILNLLGYDASSLKWGMSGWNAAFDMWSGKISSDWAAQFATDADTGKNDAGDLPVLATGETEAAGILAAQIDAYLALEKPKTIKAVDLFADLDSYYVVNYWPEAEYLAPGHIAGSHQYELKASLHSDADLLTLPTDQKIVVYCYTGQHSAQVVAWLNIMGYDAYSLQEGTNGLIYDQMIKQMWTGPGDYTYIGAPPKFETEFTKLVGYLEGEGGDFLNTSATKVVGATDVLATGLENWVVLDIRTGDKGEPGAAGFVMTPNGIADYDDGHIEGAIKVALADLIDYVKTNLTVDDKILIVCWSGQSSAGASGILNLMGYDASSLKWGMSGWNIMFDMWSAKTGSTYVDQFSVDADTGKNAAGDYPTLDTGETDPMAILETRALAYTAVEPKSIKATDLFADLDSYYIVNYWPEAEYLDPGHIAGAHQYTPKAAFHTAADLATLPIDQKIVVYCYTGQNSAQVTAYLNLLGYDAYSLLFGVNGIGYSLMTTQQWTGAGDYAWVSSM